MSKICSNAGRSVCRGPGRVWSGAGETTLRPALPSLPVLAALLTCAAWGETPPSIGSTNGPPRLARRAAAAARHAGDAIENAHETVNRYADWAVLRLDTFFADPADTGSDPPDYTLRLRLTSEFERGEKTKYGSSFATRFALPRLEKKFYIYLDNLRRDALPGRQEQKSETRTENFNAGVRFDIVRRLASLLSVDGGLYFDPMPKAFAQLRFRHYFLSDPWQGVFTQRGYWKNRTGFGEITSLDFVRKGLFSARGRSNTAVKWAENTDGVEMAQTFSFDELACVFQGRVTPAVSVSGHSAGSTMVDSYAAWITWRRRFIKPWIFINLTPQVEYPRDRDFEFTPSIWIALDLYAGVVPDD